MSTPITIEDIYKLFQRSQEEADRRFAEADRRAAEADRRAAEAKAEADRRAAEAKAEADRRAAEAKAEADRRFAEADRRAAEAKAEADRRAAEAKSEADRRAAEADRRAAELNASLTRLEKVVEQTSKEVANLTTRWGQFVENLVEPGVIRLFQSRGIEVHETHRRVQAKRGAVKMEIDVLAVNDEVVVAVEVKSRLARVDVDEFLEKLVLFKQAFPRYADVILHGAVAGIEIDQGVDRYAYRQGLFVIKQSGEMVEIANDLGFKPKAW